MHTSTEEISRTTQQNVSLSIKTQPMLVFFRLHFAEGYKNILPLQYIKASWACKAIHLFLLPELEKNPTYLSTKT